MELPVLRFPLLGCHVLHERDISAVNHGRAEGGQDKQGRKRTVGFIVHSLRASRSPLTTASRSPGFLGSLRLRKSERILLRYAVESLLSRWHWRSTSLARSTICSEAVWRKMKQSTCQ